MIARRPGAPLQAQQARHPRYRDVVPAGSRRAAVEAVEPAGVRCVVCHGTTLVPHLSVERSGDASLVATTTRYGAAPSDIVRCERGGHMQTSEFPSEQTLDEAYGEGSEA